MNIQSINSPLQNENSVFGKGKKTHKTKSHRVDKTRIQLKKSEVRQEIAKARKDEFVRTTQRSPEREAKILERKKTAIKQRMCALLGALGITAGVVGGVAVSSANQNSKPEDKTIVVTSNYDNDYDNDNDYDYVNYALDGGGYC